MGYEPFIAEISIWPANFAPRGWAFCNGQLLSISQNTALFSLLGTYYGGDGRTTFALPDLRGRTIVGAGRGPGLSATDFAMTGGNEQLALNSVQVATGGLGAEGVVRYPETLPDNRQPYLALNYIIALQGVYPSRS